VEVAHIRCEASAGEVRIRCEVSVVVHTQVGVSGAGVRIRCGVSVGEVHILSEDGLVSEEDRIRSLEVRRTAAGEGRISVEVLPWAGRILVEVVRISEEARISAEVRDF